MSKAGTVETETIVLRAYAMNWRGSHNSVSGFRNNMADVIKGNYTIPNGSPGLVVQTRNVPASEAQNKGKFKNLPGPDNIFLIKQENYYAMERVIKEFGKNSELYQKMIEADAPFVIRFGAQNERDQYRYMNWYDMVMVVTGDNRAYKTLFTQINGQKSQGKGFAVSMKQNVSG